MAWTRLPAILRYALLVVALVAIWQAYVTLGHANALLIAAPLDVARAIVTDVRNGHLIWATANTLETLLLGMAIGTAVGFALASFAVFTRVGNDLLTVLTAIFNPLPSIAVLPLAMLAFGLTPKAVVFVVALATVWPVALNTDNGFRTISPTTQLAARNLGLRGWRLVWGVLLPAALPSIITGLKTAWAFGWRTVVAAELIFGVAGAAGGLGWYINNARYFLETATIFAGLVVISMLGIVVEGVFGFVERRTIVRWGMKRSA
jgi:NitT/TauT family transport system permease protein